MSVTFVRYTQHGDASITGRLVECYREVFADSPWNEWFKCQSCASFWGLKDQAVLEAWNFRHCGQTLVDFWPVEQVLADLEHEITPEASCWLAMDGDLVVGFCWGYPVLLAQLEAKLGLSLGNLPAMNGFERVAYQDEVGVLASYRGQKIAKAMVAHRLRDFLAQGLELGVVRTRQYPEVSGTFTWYTHKLGYQIVASYPGGDGRVVLARSLAGLKDLLRF